MKKISFEYMAGLLDGEGCLYIQKYKKSRTYAARIDIGMSDKALPLLEILQSQFGGSLNLCRRKTDKWEGSSKWSIQGKQCAEILCQCFDHMILKKDQAAILIGFHMGLETLDRHPNGNIKWDEKMRLSADILKHKVNALNAKGPSGGGSSKGD